MNTEQLNQALYDKMAAEQQEFRAQLLGKTPEEILDHAYEYAMREDILAEMEDLELPAEQAEALMSSSTPLADVYQEWSDVATRHMEDIRDAVEARADSLLRDRQGPAHYAPIYRQSGEYAMEHGELDAFRASRQANVACKEAIEAAIQAGYDGMHLTADAKGVLAEFGPERVSYVLAATIQSKDWDERFSRSNKTWAAAIPMFEREDRRCPYIVHIHSTVVNGFVDMVRRELNAARDQPEKKPSIKAQLAAKSVPGDKPAVKPKDREVR